MSRFHEAREAFLDWTKGKPDWSRANSNAKDWAWRAWQSCWKPAPSGQGEDEKALRDALKLVCDGNDLAAERGESIKNWPESYVRRVAMAALRSRLAEPTVKQSLTVPEPAQAVLEKERTTCRGCRWINPDDVDSCTATFGCVDRDHYEPAPAAPSEDMIEQAIKWANMDDPPNTPGVHNARVLTAEVRRLRAALASERANAEVDVSCVLGVGNGMGKLFVRGDYESIKACQAIILERDELRATLNEERAKGKGEHEPGEPIAKGDCPCCGASLDIVYGDEEGEVSIVGIDKIGMARESIGTESAALARARKYNEFLNATINPALARHPEEENKR